jgi:murein DD-endopeptidase MepM/ murein hydrolase activator NlpD
MAAVIRTVVRRLSLLAVVIAIAAACGGGTPAAPSSSGEDCSGFGEWQNSPYVLPYPAGTTYTVEQGNCSPPGNGHRGTQRFGYDFTMTIGTRFAASRDGVVLHVEESHSDGQIAPTGFDNFIVIGHADGTTALYGHLTRDGAFVEQGQAVRQGDVIGLSGNTGNTNNRPHLHFSVQSCDPVTGGSTACPTLPVNFRNTQSNPQGLIAGVSYAAN